MGEEGKNPGYARFTGNDQINQLLNKLVRDVKEFTENQLGQIRRLTEIGVALSAEKDLDRLLEMILDEARSFTNADGGTLYTMSDDQGELHFAIIQNDTLNTRMGGKSGKITTWLPVQLKNPDGSPNYANVSAYAALSGNVVNIPDVYDAEGFNFEGTRKFDAGTGYRSKSMLVVPMRNHENDIIGVLQLLNARDVVTGEPVQFSLESEKMTEALASQAAVALTNNRLIHGLEELLESFIKSIAAAIDAKSPYTGGHVRRVAELTMTIAHKINDMKEGPYGSVSFSNDELKELRLAGWLHDVGKITTPEYVVDKATKLQTIYDRIEILRARFEVLKRDREIEALRASVCLGVSAPCGITPEDKEFGKILDEDLEFLSHANIGSEFMADEMVERLKRIAARQWKSNGELRPLLSKDELYNLSIRHGTLTDEERQVINNHATMTYKTLSPLPFPKKMRHVPLYASSHHEKLNGTGYPMGLKAEQLPLQSRILALADVFEALTAKDRPYKKGKTLSEAIKILEFMVKDGHIDSNLFELFTKEKIYLDYARKELAAHQIDVETGS